MQVYSSQKPSKTFLGYLPCLVWREYFIIIFNVKKCALYSIKYGTQSKCDVLRNEIKVLGYYTERNKMLWCMSGNLKTLLKCFSGSLQHFTAGILHLINRNNLKLLFETNALISRIKRKNNLMGIMKVVDAKKSFVALLPFFSPEWQKKNNLFTQTKVIFFKNWMIKLVLWALWCNKKF